MLKCWVLQIRQNVGNVKHCDFSVTMRAMGPIFQTKAVVGRAAITEIGQYLYHGQV